jgi:hypothetical protein
LFGGECKLCDCNGHSATCDPLTLKCDVRVEEVVVPVVVPVVASVVRVTFDNFVVVVVLMLVVVVISMLLKLDFVPIEKSS